MKNVLLISQDFPPQGFTSSRRSGSMAKYLSEFGWQPIVLCQKWTIENCWYDPTIVTNIPKNVKIYEVEVAPKHRLSWEYAKDLFLRVFNPHLFPNAFVNNSKVMIEHIFKIHNIDAIWASAPLACNHALANWASKRWDRPWVADFRDVHQFKDSLRGRPVRPIRIFYEKKLIRNASVVTTVSNGFAKSLQCRHNRIINVIPNGFDPESIAKVKSRFINKLNIVYTGGVNLGKPNFRCLLDAVAKLINSNHINQREVSINFYGAGNEKSLDRMFCDHPFRNIVNNHGHLPREKIFECQKSAAILLLATYPGTGTLTSKVYEYLAARRPILAIPDDYTDICDLLMSTKSGVCCTSVDEISSQLLKWYIEWKKTGKIQCNSNQRAIKRYSRKIQAGRLAELLNRIVE